MIGAKPRFLNTADFIAIDSKSHNFKMKNKNRLYHILLKCKKIQATIKKVKT